MSDDMICGPGQWLEKYSEFKFTQLRGQILTKIERLGEDMLIFHNYPFETHPEYGAIYLMHYPCKESVRNDVFIESITGNLNDVIGAPILLAGIESLTPQEGDLIPDDAEDTQEWTVYKLSTVKGAAEIRWFGSYDEIEDIEVRFESITLRDYEELKDAYMDGSTILTVFDGKEKKEMHLWPLNGRDKWDLRGRG